jgi:hypothetical protein
MKEKYPNKPLELPKIKSHIPPAKSKENIWWLKKPRQIDELDEDAVIKAIEESLQRKEEMRKQTRQPSKAVLAERIRTLLHPPS